MSRKKVAIVTSSFCLALCLVSCKDRATSRSPKELDHSASRKAPRTLSWPRRGDIGIWGIKSCKLCNSIHTIETVPSRIFSSVGAPQRIGDWKWQYKSKTWSGCRHEWREGYSNALPQKIADGQVVLVRKGNVYGAFILVGQRMAPETTMSTWCYGTDEDGHFNTKHPSVKCSAAPEQLDKRAAAILFGPFEIRWSGHSEGLGYIYYAAMPGNDLGKDSLAICVTDETSFEGIGPSDTKWKYRRHRFDDQ